MSHIAINWLFQALRVQKSIQNQREAPTCLFHHVYVCMVPLPETCSYCKHGHGKDVPLKELASYSNGKILMCPLCGVTYTNHFEDEEE